MIASEKLQLLYPTPESLIKARSHFKSWDAMSAAIGLSKNALYDHRKALGMEMANKNAAKPGRKFAEYLTDAEISRNIREMFADEIVNVVTTYRVKDLDELLKNPCGDEHLEVVSVGQGGVWSMANKSKVRVKVKV